MTPPDWDATLNEPGSESTPPSEHAVVVIIDDDPAVRSGLTFLLGTRYRVCVYATAREGVHAVDDDVCAVILDVKMRGEDGFWACKEIYKRTPDMPVIFYSAYQDLKNPIDLINEHHPFGYLVKGDDPGSLLSMLASAVERRARLISSRKLGQRLQTQPSSLP